MSADAKEANAVFSSCRKLDGKDPEFKAWLRAYASERRMGWARNNHEYWAVPAELVPCGAHKMLAGGRECCYLARGFDNMSILSIAPNPNPIFVTALTTLAIVIRLGMKLFAPIFKWGQNRCPNCLGADLHPFMCESAEVAPHHYCNGCNTIWTPR